MIESRYPLRPLGDVLTLDREEVTVEPTETYRTAGIYSFGKGLFERDPVRGAETSYASLVRLREGQVVISRLNGWEGALDVVSPRLAGAFVSNEYPTFTVAADKGSVAYLQRLIHWPPVWDAMRPRGSMVRRRRVHPDDFLALEVPLPDLDEQARVAALTERRLLQHRAIAASAEDASLAGESAKWLPGAVAAAFPATSPPVALSTLVDVVSDVVHPGDDVGEADRFIGLQHIQSHTGRQVGEEPLADEKGRKFRFRPGDILYGYLRPYLNKVWLADTHGLCSVDQYVLRPRDPAGGPLIAHALRSSDVLDQAIALTHSLTLPRLRSGLLLALSIPTAPARRASEVLEAADTLVRIAVDLAAARERRQSLLNALEQSILNQAFAGLL